MCQRQFAWNRPCGRYHISVKCSDKRNCAVYKKQKEIDKKISFRTPKCEACYGVPLYAQIWHWLGDWVRWLLSKFGLSKIGKYVAWMFWMVFVAFVKTASFALGVQKIKRGKWWPRGFGTRLVIVIRGVVFLALLIFTLNKTFQFFGIFQTYVPWYCRVFWAVTSPVRVPLKWTWYQLTGPRRGTVEKVLYWVWDHTPAEVQALCHFMRGVLHYYVGWTWCEVKCNLFAQNGYMRSVRVKGCRWECFTKL